MFTYFGLFFYSGSAVFIFPDRSTTSADERIVADEGLAFSSFRKLTEDEVRSPVMASPKKYCALGAMPTPLVADCLDLLLPVITHLINSSLTAGYFPSAWKEALITPHLKESGA